MFDSKQIYLHFLDQENKQKTYTTYFSEIIYIKTEICSCKHNSKILDIINQNIRYDKSNTLCFTLLG